MAVASLVAVTLTAELAPWATTLGCCTGPLTALAVPLLDAVLLASRWYSGHLLAGRCILMLAAVLLAFGAGLLMGIGGGREAFGEVFGTYPPPTVREISGQRQYRGIFDRDDILLRFVTDGVTLDKIMADKGFNRDDAKVAGFKTGKATWDAFCDAALLSPSGKYGRWGPSKPMAQPVLYLKREEWSQGDCWGVTAVLFDASTGETFVHQYGGN